MSLPTMNNRLNRREEMLSRILAPRPVSEAVNTNIMPPSASRLTVKHPLLPDDMLTINQTPPQDRIVTNDDQSQKHRRTASHTTSAPSFESSACSDPDTVTNYGIARALNAEIIVPNIDNPIATMKDR